VAAVVAANDLTALGITPDQTSKLNATLHRVLRSVGP